jgi:Flp pilus assembly protein TadD
VFAILRVLVENDWAGFAGAVLFALHPVQVEPVAWVTGMKDILCGLLSIVALWQYLKYAESKMQPHKKDKTRNYLLATSSFVLALLAKPAALVVPILAWVLIGFRFRDRYSGAESRHLYPSLLIWVIASIPFVLLARLSQAAAVDFVTPLWARPLVAGDAVTFYLYKAIVPVRLAIDYGRSPQAVLQHASILLTGLLPYALAGLVWVFRARLRILFTSTAIFAVALLPTLGLLDFGFQAYSTVADRYLYLALFGPALAVASLLSLRPRYINRRVLGGLCLLVLALPALGTSLQIRHWRSNASLFQHALSINQGSSAAHNNLGLALEADGKTAEAIAHFRQAVRIMPKAPKAYNNLGIALAEEGETAEAIAHFRTALRLRSNFAEAHRNLGIALCAQGKSAEAVAHYREALRTNPNDPEVHNNLGTALIANGKTSQAIVHFQEALRIRPNDAAASQNLEIAMSIHPESQ